MSPFSIPAAHHNVHRYAQSICDIWSIVILEHQIPSQVFNKSLFSYEVLRSITVFT